MGQDKEKWGDTDPRQKDDRSEILKHTADTEKNKDKKEQEKDKKDEPMIWGTGSDGGAAGDGSAA